MLFYSAGIYHCLISTCSGFINVPKDFDKFMIMFYCTNEVILLTLKGPFSRNNPLRELHPGPPLNQIIKLFED